MKTIDDRISDFLRDFDIDDMSFFLELMGEIWGTFENYTSDEPDDNHVKMKLIRSVYLISRLADEYGTKLFSIKCNHKGLWKRLEEIDDKYRESLENEATC